MTNVLRYLQWFKNKNPQTLIRKREEPGGSLYTWFSDLTICFGESAVLIGWGKWNISVASTAIFISTAPAAAKSLQSCPTLCDPTDGSPPGSPVPGILQARTLEWVAISFSNARKWEVKVKSLSRVRFLATPWIAAHQVPLSMGFSRQEHKLSGIY